MLRMGTWHNPFLVEGGEMVNQQSTRLSNHSNQLLGFAAEY